MKALEHYKKHNIQWAVDILSDNSLNVTLRRRIVNSLIIYIRLTDETNHMSIQTLVKECIDLEDFSNLRNVGDKTITYLSQFK